MRRNSYKIGILALQGDVAEHAAIIRKIGAEACEIRAKKDAERARPDALILPGGESTTMMKWLETGDLKQWLVRSVRAGLPVLATCAGVIVLSKSHLNLLDIEVDRNAYGSQLDSFETEIKRPTPNAKRQTIKAIFIRAPKIIKIGKGVEILAKYEGSPILVQQKNILGATFHPELAQSTVLHQALIDLI